MVPLYGSGLIWYHKHMANQYRRGTVCFICQADQVLLALIEYGPNERKWTGIGGFAEAGELLKDAVIREVNEETYIAVDKNDVYKVAEVNDSPTFQLNVFIAHSWRGKLEIKDRSLKELQWFPKDRLPVSEMHKGNDRWLPQALNGKLLTVANGEIREVTEFTEE